MSRNSYRIAVIPGDGIGREVVPEGVRVLEAVAARHGLDIRFDWFDFANCDYYVKHGEMMPEDWKAQIGGHDAIYFGSIGNTKLVPDSISGWGSIMKFRREFDQYINLRPVKLLPGIPCPLAGRGPGDIDMVIVRENTEGEYSPIGGRQFVGTERETAMQASVMTRIGIDRAARYAYELARSRPRRKLTSATKGNALTYTLKLWDERVEAVGSEYPDVTYDKKLVDALVARMVLAPGDFDVVVASNLFGDILSDLAAGMAGTLGIAPSGNINPEKDHPSMFEPVHGSAPDISGQGIANPIAQIWAGAMMLDHLGEASAARAVEAAIARALGEAKLRTRDMGGTATTEEAGKGIAALVE
ncbi:MAG TPA: tartrate dehydrogenase [Rhizobiaceae bacterium]|nr:tartrate dehydrogenase [Rhizobiaceae bacterium]